MSIKEIVIDCDPGQDDALAILMALGAKNIKVKALSVVAGNVGVDKTLQNACKILSLAKREDIPIYKGATKPLKQKHVTLEDVFGYSGMDGTSYWPCLKGNISSVSASDFLSDLYSSQSNIHLCALAPQTNIAHALKRNSLIATNIPSLTIMGRCVFKEHIHNRFGNISYDGGKTYAEYNFATDPEAVHQVLSSKIKQINLIGLDVTRKILYNGEIDKKLRSIGWMGISVADMLATVGPEDVLDYGVLRKNKNDPVRAIHDAVAMAYLIEPSIFVQEKIPLKIDLINTRGKTLIDDEGFLVNVIRKVNEKSFFDIMFQTLKNLK